MTHAHNHCHCDHELKFCDRCDVVYCKKCSREWKSSGYTWYYSAPWYSQTGQWTLPGQTVSGSTTTATSGYIQTAMQNSQAQTQCKHD